VIVVHGFIVTGRIFDGVVDKGNAAFLHLVGKLELVEHFELADRFQLCLFPRCEGINTHVRIWIDDLMAGLV